MQVDITIQPTPNPNAIKFILNYDVKKKGKSTYRSADDCKHNPMALELFTIRGVDQVHFFKNCITISKFGYEEWDNIEHNALSVIEKKFDVHNAEYEDPNPEAERIAALTPELRDIEAVLDKTIRPGLQADGGDLVCLSYQDNVLVIKYEGACGSCPSSTMGTLEAIKGILKEQYNPDIEVYIAPEF